MNKRIEKAKKSKIFPEEKIDEYSSDLKDLIEEHERQKNEELDKKLMDAYMKRDSLLDEMNLLGT